jgi:hypothetical protein
VRWCVLTGEARAHSVPVGITWHKKFTGLLVATGHGSGWGLRGRATGSVRSVQDTGGEAGTTCSTGSTLGWHGHARAWLGLEWPVLSFDLELLGRVQWGEKVLLRHGVQG